VAGLVAEFYITTVLIWTSEESVHQHLKSKILKQFYTTGCVPNSALYQQKSNDKV